MDILRVKSAKNQNHEGTAKPLKRPALCVPQAERVSKILFGKEEKGKNGVKKRGSLFFYS